MAQVIDRGVSTFFPDRSAVIVNADNSNVEAGADGIFVQTNGATLDDFEKVLAEVGALAPIVVTPTALPDTPADVLHGMGVDVIIFANVVIRAVTRGVSDALAIDPPSGGSDRLYRRPHRAPGGTLRAHGRLRVAQRIPRGPATGRRVRQYAWPPLTPSFDAGQRRGDST